MVRWLKRPLGEVSPTIVIRSAKGLTHGPRSPAMLAEDIVYLSL